MPNKAVEVHAWWNERAQSLSTTRERRLLGQVPAGQRFPPDAEAFAFAAACVEAGLYFSQGAAQGFLALCDTWRSDLRAMHEDCMTACRLGPAEVIEWRDFVTQAMVRHDQAPSLGALDVLDRTHGPRVQVCVGELCQFVRRHYNRPLDIQRGTAHIHPSPESPAVHVLWVAIAFDATGLSFDQLDQARLGSVSKAISDPHPREYADRRLRAALVHAWKRHEWRMLHDSTLTSRGRAWYRARVDPGRLDDGIDELSQYSDRGYSYGGFEDRIQDYDSAMQYSRSR